MTSVLRALHRLNLHLHPNLHTHTRTHNIFIYTHTHTYTHTFTYTHTHTYTRKPRHVSSMLALVKCMIMLLVACWGFVSQLLPPQLTSAEVGPPYALFTGLHRTSSHSRPKFRSNYFVFTVILEYWLWVCGEHLCLYHCFLCILSSPSPPHAHPVHTCVNSKFSLVPQSVLNFQQMQHAFLDFMSHYIWNSFHTLFTFCILFIRVRFYFFITIYKFLVTITQFLTVTKAWNWQIYWFFFTQNHQD